MRNNKEIATGWTCLEYIIKGFVNCLVKLYSFRVWGLVLYSLYIAVFEKYIYSSSMRILYLLYKSSSR